MFPFDMLLKMGFDPFNKFKKSPTTVQTQVQRLRSDLFDYGPQQDKTERRSLPTGSASQSD
jgi:hypothetical protein